MSNCLYQLSGSYSIALQERVRFIVANHTKFGMTIIIAMVLRHT